MLKKWWLLPVAAVVVWLGYGLVRISELNARRFQIVPVQEAKGDMVLYYTYAGGRMTIHPVMNRIGDEHVQDCLLWAPSPWGVIQEKIGNIGQAGPGVPNQPGVVANPPVVK